MVGLLCFLLFPVGHAFAEPVVTHVSGQAEIRAAGSAEWVKLRRGTTLEPGSAIRTGNNSGATVTDTAAKTTIRVKAKAELGFDGSLPVDENAKRPPSLRPVPSYSLPQGNADATIEPGNPLDLLTPLIVTSVRGTRFTASVAADGSSKINVMRGSVFVTDKLGRQASLSAGQSHSLAAREFVREIRLLPKVREPGPSGVDSGGGDSGSGGGDSGGGGGDDGGDD